MKRYWREIGLLMLPFLVILGVVAWVQVRRIQAPFVRSNTPVQAAFFGAAGEIVSVGVLQPTPPARRSGSVVVARFDAKSGAELNRATLSSEIYAPALSPDGRWLASFDFVPRGNLFLVLRDVKNGFFARAPLDTGSASMMNLVWKRDSSGIYLLGKRGTQFCSVNEMVLKPQPRWKRVFGAGFPANAAFSANGKWIAFSSAAQPIQKVRPLARFSSTLSRHGDAVKVCTYPNLKLVATLPGDSFGPPTFTSDGQSLLATACFLDGYEVVSAHIARLDLQTLKTRFTKIEGEGAVLSGLRSAVFARWSRFGRDAI